MQIDDFVARLRTQLDARKASYVEKLIASPSGDHDRYVGTIRAYDETRKLIDSEAKRYLVEEEAA